MKNLSLPEIVNSLIEILVDVLEFDRSEVRETTTIRELGVTSLHAIELLEAFNTRFDLSQPTSVVFEFSTIGALAGYLEKTLAVRAGAHGEEKDDEPAASAALSEAPPVLAAALAQPEPRRR